MDGPLLSSKGTATTDSPSKKNPKNPDGETCAREVKSLNISMANHALDMIFKAA